MARGKQKDQPEPAACPLCGMISLNVVWHVYDVHPGQRVAPSGKVLGKDGRFYPEHHQKPE